MWVHQYTHRRILKRKVIKFGQAVFLRNKLRRWKKYALFLAEVEVRLKQAKLHFERALQSTLLCAWNRCVEQHPIAISITKNTCVATRRTLSSWTWLFGLRGGDGGVCVVAVVVVQLVVGSWRFCVVVVLLL